MSKYYSLTRILKKNAAYNVVFGMRSNGKTYAALSYALEQWLKNKRQFAIIRRWKEDVIGRRASGIFAQLNADGVISKASKGVFEGVYYFASKLYLCTYDDEGRPVYNEKGLCGHTFALSDTEHNKSIQYPYVSTIIFDEFISRGAYLPDEFILFMNTVSTIIRNRDDVKIIMLGNTVNTHCPYFREMGLNHISKMKLGDIDLYRYGDSRLTVAVEYCANHGAGKDASKYFAFDNPRLSMITEGAWELDSYPHCPVKYTGKQVVLEYFIIFDGATYQCDIVDAGNDVFTFIHVKTTPLRHPDTDIIFTLDYNPAINYNINILKPSFDWQRKITWFFNAGRVYYQDNHVGNAISQYLAACKR